MSGPVRLEAGGGAIDRMKPLRFAFDGQSLSGFAGDTVASALLAEIVFFVGNSPVSRNDGIAIGPKIDRTELRCKSSTEDSDQGPHVKLDVANFGRRFPVRIPLMDFDVARHVPIDQFRHGQPVAGGFVRWHAAVVRGGKGDNPSVFLAKFDGAERPGPGKMMFRFGPSGLVTRIRALPLLLRDKELGTRREGPAILAVSKVGFVEKFHEILGFNR